MNGGGSKHSVPQMVPAATVTDTPSLLGLGSGLESRVGAAPARQVFTVHSSSGVGHETLAQWAHAGHLARFREESHMEGRAWQDSLLGIGSMRGVPVIDIRQHHTHPV